MFRPRAGLRSVLRGAALHSVGALLVLMASAHALRAQSTAFVDSEATPGPLRQVAPVMSAHAMIVTANAHASQAGLEMLQAGGTAADAAAAAAFALNVVEP
jgi:gamma-glutamyltranspeptidase/glutathione hydrolase